MTINIGKIVKLLGRLVAALPAVAAVKPIVREIKGSKSAPPSGFRRGGIRRNAASAVFFPGCRSEAAGEVHQAGGPSFAWKGEALPQFHVTKSGPAHHYDNPPPNVLCEVFASQNLTGS